MARQSRGGGGIAANDGNLTVVTSTIEGNIGGPNTEYGVGGILVSGGVATVLHSTIADNISQVDGYGGGVAATSGATVNIGASIVSSNTSPAGTGPSANNCSMSTANGSGNAASTLNDLGYNVSNGSSCPFSASSSVENSTTVALGALANNGGPTETMAVDPGSSAFNIVPVSSSLCEGTYSLPAGTSFVLAAMDQRGEPRPQSGYEVCSSGAYQDQLAATPAPTPLPSPAKAPSTVTVPTTHTGEPWDGSLYWILTGLVALAGAAVISPKGGPFRPETSRHHL